MRTELQNHAWACLPKEVRDKMRLDCAKKDSFDWDKGYRQALKSYFGSHNLASDTEPEEMVMIQRKKVQEMYDYNDAILVCDPTHNRAKLLADKLKELFGDKCLPDKDEQSKPKFEKGRKVVVKGENRVLTIDELFYNSHSHFWYAIFVETGGNFTKRLSELEPYTEEEQSQDDAVLSAMENYRKTATPEQKAADLSRLEAECLSDKVERSTLCENCINESYASCKLRLGDGGALMNIDDRESCDDYKPKQQPKFDIGDKVEHFDMPGIWEIVECHDKPHISYKIFKKETDSVFWASESNLRPYIEKKEELNLCALLKGCEGETFYSLIEGDVQLSSICDISIFCGHYNYHLRGCLVSAQSNGICLLYPSRALYKKYPLDAYSAWMEWMESRRKYVLEVKLSSWFDEGDKHLWNTEWFEFNSKEEVQQAAEGLREYLQKFNEK